ncbi:MAG: hypothetical protein ACE5I5_00635 [Candidatus Heimdallarchaeota archaeon]
MLQGRFEASVKKIARILRREDPRITERSTKLPIIKVNLERELDLSRPDLGVQLGLDRILLPNVPEALVAPFLVKVAFDWLFLPYLQKLPKPAHLFSFLTPWFFLKKSEMWQSPWEKIWEEVFPSAIYHEGHEFSRQYLMSCQQHDDILLLLDFHACVEKCMQHRLKILPEMFLKDFFDQISSLRVLNKTEKRILTIAIDLGSANPKRLAEELNLPRSTAYHIVTRCLRKLHLTESPYLKWYCFGLEPIIFFFLDVEQDTNIIEKQFRAIPYFYNSARLITPENERAGREIMTLLINLRFPGSFTSKLRSLVKKFTIDRGGAGFHYFRYDRLEHGFALQKFGIDVQKHRKFDKRGGITAKRVDLLPGDFLIIAYRLLLIGSRAAPKFGYTLKDIERFAGIKVSRSVTTEKQLFPQVVAGKDITIALDHFIKYREFRLIIRNPTPDELMYFRSAFPEYYFYNDVNERELLVLLMVPEEQSQEIEDFVSERTDRVILSGYNRGPLYSHLFNIADLEEEYDYEQQKWLDPFRSTEWWEWML